MLVELIGGNYHWNLEYDVCGFWDRFLDGMAEAPRDTTPRDLVRRAYTEAHFYGVEFAPLLENRLELYA